MAYWLVKSEPDSFSWDDQVRKGTEPWTGVRNAQAARHLREMRARRPRLLLPLQHRQGDRRRRRGGPRSLPGPHGPVRALGLRRHARRGADAAAGDARRGQGRPGLRGPRPGAVFAPLGPAGLAGALAGALPHGRVEGRPKGGKGRADEARRLLPLRRGAVPAPLGAPLPLPALLLLHLPQDPGRGRLRDQPRRRCGEPARDRPPARLDLPRQDARAGRGRAPAAAPPSGTSARAAAARSGSTTSAGPTSSTPSPPPSTRPCRCRRAPPI